MTKNVMITRKLLLLLLLFSVSLIAQVSYSVIIPTTPPGGIGGACNSSAIAYLMPTGGGNNQLVVCTGNVWTVSGGGGGGGSLTPAGPPVGCVQWFASSTTLGCSTDLTFITAGLSDLRAAGIGPISVVGSASMLNFNGSYSTTLDVDQSIGDGMSTFLTLAVGNTFAPAVDSSRVVWNEYAQLQTGGTHAISGEMIAGFFEFDHNGTGAFTGAGGIGVDGEAYNDTTGTAAFLGGGQFLVGNFGSGLVAEADAINTTLRADNGGPITKAISAHMLESTGDSVIGTAYHIFLEPLDIGAANYGIYANLSAGEIGETIQRASMQTADLLDFLDSDGTTKLCSFNSSGVLSSSCLPSGLALTASPLSQFASTTSAQLRGIISDESGSGVAIFGGSTLFEAPIFRGTSSTISGALTIGTCNTATVTVTGATTGMVVGVSPVTNPDSGAAGLTRWDGYVSSSNTVTVRECGLGVVTPNATAYNVAVTQ